MLNKDLGLNLSHLGIIDNKIYQKLLLQMHKFESFETHSRKVFERYFYIKAFNEE